MGQPARVTAAADAPSAPARVLTVNAGSSSVKFAIFRTSPALGLLSRGAVEAADGCSAAHDLWDALERDPHFAEVGAVGHRVVHGMRRVEPARVDGALLRELHGISPMVPDHLPRAIELIELFRDRRPSVPQVACFDTAFHQGMPRVAKLLAVPRRLEAQGVQRYGFHGLSCAYLMEELARTAGPGVAAGRVILAHLGGGASLTAMRGGMDLDTSMGFTPASGLVMGTRAGDADPGLVSFLARTDGVTVAQFDHMMNRESGLLGVSETSADMRDLLAREATDVRAAEAVALFCYQARKWIGAFVAALEGLDTLVFAGGIGENAAPIRARICAGLAFLGVEVDAARNARGVPLISSGASRVGVRVIRTDEEVMVARSVVHLLGVRS
jgi:acetate kinase